MKNAPGPEPLRANVFTTYKSTARVTTERHRHRVGVFLRIIYLSVRIRALEEALAVRAQMCEAAAELIDHVDRLFFEGASSQVLLVIRCLNLEKRVVGKADTFR